jgi:rSAM/selenodomain-associated transferase 1
MSTKNILIIFAKNLIYGKVKTRLAASIGNDNAYEIYKELLYRTRSVIQKIKVDKVVYYSELIQANGDVFDANFLKATQMGNDLGERMMNAFREMFDDGYNKAVIIGTDCPSLNEEIINEAFEKLNENDVVIGPASDGGYYLSGIKKLHHCLFENVHWSTQTVLIETLSICDSNNLAYFLLPALHDIDEEKDLVHLRKLSA